MVAIIMLSVIPFGSYSVSAQNDSAEYISNYDAYLKNSAISTLADKDIAIALDTVIGSDTEFKNGKIIWNGEESIEFKVNISEDRLYNLKIVWKPLETGVDLNFGIMLDGKYPFELLEKVTLSRMWKNASKEPRTDAQGNEYAPEQIETGEAIESLICDKTGTETEPYKLALKTGEHSFIFEKTSQKIEISEISLTAPEQIKSYKELAATYKIENIDATVITLQGEEADAKSSSSFIPKSNNTDPAMTPSNAYATKINYIGSTAWKNPTDSLSWNFEVEKSGYYYFYMRYKQTDLVNGDSFRWLKIDGKTPFEEAKTLRFSYKTGWRNYIFGDENEPYYIWLDKGSHTLSLEVTAGEQSEHFSRLSEIVNTLGDEYIKIVMITGESPDVNRDYELFNQIPNFNETLTECYNKLTSLAEDMKEKSGKQSTQAIATIENMARVLNSMIKSPYVAQQYVKDYYTTYTSLSSWLYDMVDMPLSIDELRFVPSGEKFEGKKVGFFTKLIFGTKALIASFTRDYSLTNKNDTNSKRVRLWVNWGQDQASVLNSLIEDSFTPKTGINVELEIVNASLINGILSGNFPDVSLHMARTEPINLGIRGALADLTQFSDCEEVLTRFTEGAEIPYTYKDALYALPDMQSFFVMFYRTDIFKNLSLTAPKTWDEFMYAATVIQRNNMSVYVPYTQITTSTTVNAGIGSLNLFPTLMKQNSLSLYNSELNATALRTKEAVRVFEEWTDFYTKFAFYKEADFYNRFRVGAMPLGIAPYSTYTTFYSTAPEIQGRWAIATVPGTGEKRTIAGAGTGCAIIEKSSNKEEAWEFLKWWTSAETQARYSKNVESILGMIGRVTTSTVEAVKSLAWESEDLEVLMEQWELVSEVEEVPGSYYLTRAVDQAYWEVVNGDSKAKDALTKWSKVADDEIARKIKEYY